VCFCAGLLVLILTIIAATVDAAVNSAHYMPIGCQKYSEQGGELERCSGLYTLDRTWDEAMERCLSDGWSGLALATNDDVEKILGDFMVWMNEELDADNGYSAWIGGHEVDDRIWKWSDGKALQRQCLASYLYLLCYHGYLLHTVVTTRR